MGINKIVLLGGSGIGDGFKGEMRLYPTGISTEKGDGSVICRERNDGTIFIPRHGNPQKYGPSATQYAANLVAAKCLGATVVLATSCVGSLRPETIGIESLVLPDDYVDETGRDDNLFGIEMIVHANPRPAFSEELQRICYREASHFKLKAHLGGTYVAIPGDRFGTTAEGRKRANYADIVGMTVCPEASLALQLGLYYVALAFVVDLDTDANHQSKTLETMKKLSVVVPDYLNRVIKAAELFASNPPLLPQLKGNIIADDINRIENPVLRGIAKELISNYCP